MKHYENSFLSVRHADVPVAPRQGRDHSDQSITQTRCQSHRGMWLGNQGLRGFSSSFKHMTSMI